MSSFLWIAAALLAMIGFAQCVEWIIRLRRKPKGMPGCYQMVALYDDPAQIEAYLRYGVGCLRRNGCRDVAILVDMGLGDECAAVCERFVRENPGLICCGVDQLADVVRELEQALADSPKRTAVHK